MIATDIRLSNRDRRSVSCKTRTMRKRRRKMMDGRDGRLNSKFSVSALEQDKLRNSLPAAKVKKRYPTLTRNNSEGFGLLRSILLLLSRNNIASSQHCLVLRTLYFPCCRLLRNPSSELAGSHTIACLVDFSRVSKGPRQRHLQVLMESFEPPWGDTMDVSIVFPDPSSKPRTK